jgi:hypothetical protein
VLPGEPDAGDDVRRIGTPGDDLGGPVEQSVVSTLSRSDQ